MKLKWMALGLLLAATAQADNTDMSGMNMTPGSTMNMPGTKSDFMKDMNAGMTKMDKDMSGAPMTGNPDKDFASMMIPHHQGAIDMAEVELKYGKDPEMRKLAKAIIAAQKKEIAQMNTFLKK